MEKQTKERKKVVGIFVGKSALNKPWDLDSCESGIPGSEEAVIYISIELAKLGFEVIIFGDPPENSRHISQDDNPRFVDFNWIETSSLDIAISWRMPNIASYLKKRAHKVYFWPHDFCVEDVSEIQINSFDGVLWLSQWQRQDWILKNPLFSKFNCVFGNGINLNQFNPVQERDNPFSCIYGSNYGRGLELLLDIWPSIYNLFPKATLDIYYGWESFGLLNPKTESRMRHLIEQFVSLGVKEHGLVGHQELVRAYERASFWTYPCAYSEAFCITALKAQYAGAFPIVIEEGALKETVRHGTSCSQKDQYCSMLIHAMKKAEKITLKERWIMREFIWAEFTWSHIAEMWKEFFN